MKKPISVSLCVCLIVQTLLANQFPSSLGHSLSFPIENSQKEVILIQDLHGNSAVQKTIKDILSFYDTEGLVGDHVFVEGGFGNIDSSYLISIKDKSLKSTICNDLLNTGDLTGAEYFAVSKERPHLLYGIDDKNEYWEHLKLFQDSYEERTQLAGEIKGLRLTTLNNAKLLSSHKLKDMLESMDRFNQNQTDIIQYFSKIVTTSKELRISLDKDYPELSRMRQWIKFKEFNWHINFVDMYVQLELLTYDICWKLAKVGFEKENVNFIFGLDFLDKLLKNEITGKELEVLMPQLPDLTKHINEKLEMDVTEIIKKALEFYRLAYIRDQSMTDNLIAQMEKENLSQAIAIIGGFHSNGMVNILKEHGISSIVISPLVEAHTEIDTQKYIDKLKSATYLAIPYLDSRNKIFAQRINNHSQRISFKIDWKKSIKQFLKTVMVLMVFLPFFGGVACTGKPFDSIPQTQIVESPKKTVSSEEFVKLNILRNFMRHYEIIPLDKSNFYNEEKLWVQPEIWDSLWKNNRPLLHQDFYDEFKNLYWWGNELGFLSYILKLSEGALINRSQFDSEIDKMLPYLYLSLEYMQQHKKEFKINLSLWKKQLETFDENMQKLHIESFDHITEWLMDHWQIKHWEIWLEEQEEKPISQTQNAIIFPNAPVANTVKIKTPIQIRIESIEQALDEDTTKSAKRPRFSWIDSFKNQKIQLSNYWKRKLSDIIVPGFLITEMLFILGVSVILAIQTTLDRIKGTRIAITDRFPILKSEISIVWLISVLGFLYQTFLINDSSIMNPMQLIFAISGTMATIAILFSNPAKERPSFISRMSTRFKSGRDTGHISLGLSLFVIIVTIIAPLAFKSHAVAWIFGFLCIAATKALRNTQPAPPTHRLQMHFFRQA